MSRSVRVGNGAGFWGDNLDAPFLLARDGKIDYLTLEYLAELTLAILSHIRVKDPNAGYINDFPDLLERLHPILDDQPHLKIVTNAGGLNPVACAKRCATLLGNKIIGVVSGDDVLGNLYGWLDQGIDLQHMETGEPLSRSLVTRFVSASAYLGAEPIARALGQGARIVITGRVADASLTLGPALHEFAWPLDDWDRLAGATVAGHVIECGAQASGGLWHHWSSLDNLAGVGYPIAELAEDGTSVITKAEGSGGSVEVGTIAEQLVYEIDDPTRYRTPDVDVDLTALQLYAIETNRVRITDCRGQAPGEKLKLACVYRDGYTASGLVAVVGRNAEAKARAAGQIVLDRVRNAGFDLADSLVECLGAGDVVPGLLKPETPPREVVLRITVRDPRKAAVERFCREIAPLVTAGPPGIAGYASGRPSPKPAFGYWPCLVPRSLVTPEVEVRSAREWYS